MRMNMKSILYNIQKSFQRNALFVLAVMMVGPVFAQDFEEEDEEEESLKRRVYVEAEKYDLVEVKGIILDEITKAPLGGIQVKALANKRYTAMSDDDGTFTIKVPKFITALYVYAPEFSSHQVAINPLDPDEIVKVYMLSDKFRPMYEDGTSYTAKRGFTATGGHAFTIDTELQEQLLGDVRSVQRSGAVGIGNNLFIRGLNSINATSAPLIIVDGIEMDQQLSREMLHQGDLNNMLASVMPEDIENVTVLKNATALYGSRGANGVILIDTKRGHSMATRIDANLSVGLTLVPRLQEMMNADQYRTYVSELIGTMDGLKKSTPTLNFLNDDVNGYYYNMYHNDYDWQDDVYRTALTQNYNINVQGGDNVGMYNLSVGYVDGNSTAEGFDYSRMNVRFNTDIDILRTLSTKFNIAISRTTAQVFDDGLQEDFSTNTPTSPTTLAALKSPLVTPYQYSSYTGGFTSLLSDADDLFDALGDGYSLANPLAILEADGSNRNYRENTNFQVALAPTLTIGRYWSITEHFAFTLNRNSQRYTRPSSGVPGFYLSDIGTVYNQFSTFSSSENNIVSDTRANFSKIFGPSTLKAFVGFRYNYFSYNSESITTQYSSRQDDKNPVISGGSTSNYTTSVGVDDVWKQIQWYGNIDYDYKNRYFLTVSLLGEANSRFGENCSGLDMFGTKWQLYPSVQLGWVLTNESWFPKNTGVDYLRINAGFDMSGNDDIANSAARTVYTVTLFNNYPGLQLTNIGNDEIKSETTYKYNIGLQGNFLHNRLSFGVDWFYNKTTDLLTLKNFSTVISGINKYWSNGGELENTGFEVTFSGKPVVTKNFNIELGATIGHYKNEVTKLPDGDYTSSIYGDDNILTAVGNPLAVFYGYKTEGVFSTDEEAQVAGDGTYLYFLDDTGTKQYFTAGDVHFSDLNGDGVIDENDKTIIGDPNPDIYGNIFAMINWKNFTLSANFTYSLGNDVYNYMRYIYNSSSNFYNQQVAVTNRWRYEGQVTDMPKATYGDPMGNNRFSDRWIEDGSYLRLKSLKLTYKVPVYFSWLQGLSIWAEAINLFTITKYLGNDPEFSINSSSLYQGIDCGNLAQSRAFTLGVKINL